MLAAILDFVIQKWCYSTLRPVGRSMSTCIQNFVKTSQIAGDFPFFKMPAGCHLGFCYRSKTVLRHVADCPCILPCQIWWQYLKWQLSYCDSPFFKMAATTILNLLSCRFWSHNLFLVAAIYIPTKFHFITVSQPADELLRFVEKFKMVVPAILNLYLAILDHPQSLLMDLKWHCKFGVNRTFTFQDIVILKFGNFGLKRLFRPPKFTFTHLTPFGILVSLLMLNWQWRTT